jgi:hypothetical protein
MASGCDICWSNCRAEWARRFHGLVRTGLIRRDAYRFFGNDRFSEANILAGHFASTRERFVATSDSPVLILHDTTEFSYRHEDSAALGILKKIPAGHRGRAGLYTSCGILMHSSLVITGDALPLGLARSSSGIGISFHGANHSR